MAVWYFSPIYFIHKRKITPVFSAIYKRGTKKIFFILENKF